MSTTPDRSVALGYSGVEIGEDLPTIFEIEVGAASIGADISWLSQFAGEKEFLYAPLTHLQIVGTPRLEIHNGNQLSIVRMQLTVNQKSKTIEQTERSRKDSLGQLAHELQSVVRYWAHQNKLLECLGAQMTRMRSALQTEVDDAEAHIVNNNSGLATVFERIINTSEEHRIIIAEMVWTEGKVAKARGEVSAAVKLFEIAIEARGIGLCADSKAGRDRVVEMRQQVLLDRWGKGVGGGADGVLVMREEGSGWGGTEQDAVDKFNLARNLLDSGDYDEAVALYQEAIALFTEVYGCDCKDVSDSYNEIGVVYNVQGKYHEALQQHQKSLEIRTQVFGYTHQEVAALYINIAIVYGNQGKYKEALEHYHQSLEIFTKVLGCKHEKVATSYTGIGNVFYSQDDFENARVHHQKSLDIMIRVHGHVHSAVALSYNNIGVACMEQGKYDEALECYQKDLEITIKLVGNVHLDVASSYNNIGNVYVEQDKLEEALEYYQKDLEITIQVVGQVHPDVSKSYNNMGNLFQQQGDYENALILHHKSFEIKTQVLGYDHPDVALSKYNMANLHEEQGNLEEARQLFLECHSIYAKAFGADHEETLDAAMRAETVGQDSGSEDSMYNCDGCRIQICGVRWTCQDCDGYDFCQQCYTEFLASGEHHEETHVFAKVEQEKEEGRAQEGSCIMVQDESNKTTIASPDPNR